MTFIPDYPSAQNSPLGSYAQIQTNYAQYASIFSSQASGVIYNHFPLNSSTQGNHAAVLFDNQITDPPVTNNLVALYAKKYPANVGQPELFLRIKNFLPNGMQNYPMMWTLNTVSLSSPYQSFLLGGYIIFWGSATRSGPDTTLITLSPAPSSLINAFASANQGTSTSGSNIGTQILTSSTFNIVWGMTPVFASAGWMAIGVA
jgi:hypothetical protein